MNIKILAGIIVYSPDKNLIKLVENLLDQKIDVFLFINKGNSFSEYLLKKNGVYSSSKGINIGVSDALNEIISNFLSKNYEYLFTFDQDSMVDINFVDKMIHIFEKAYIKNKSIVCCSPTILDIKYQKKNRNLYKIKKEKEEFQYVNFAITSGSLFNKASFNNVGKMNPILFIDGVDTDWCERANILNFKLIKANNIFLKHKIGSKYINFFGIKKSYHDQDLRVYYIMRNSLYLLIYGSNTIRWKVSEILRTMIRFLAYPFLSSTKIKTLFYIFLAFNDVFRGNMGKMKYLEH